MDNTVMMLTRKFVTPRKLTLAGAVVAVVILVLISGIFPWSELNCRHEEIDLNSGRIRHSRRLFYVSYDERIEETWLSQALGDSASSPEWRKVNTFSPGLGHSPHYLYHGAISQIRELELIETFVPIEPAARRVVARRLLQSWQESGSYFAAGKVIEQVGAKVIALREAGAHVITSAELPFE